MAPNTVHVLYNNKAQRITNCFIRNTAVGVHVMVQEMRMNCTTCCTYIEWIADVALTTIKCSPTARCKTA